MLHLYLHVAPCTRVNIEVQMRRGECLDKRKPINNVGFSWRSQPSRQDQMWAVRSFPKPQPRSNVCKSQAAKPVTLRFNICKHEKTSHLLRWPSDNFQLCWWQQKKKMIIRPSARLVSGNKMGFPLTRLWNISSQKKNLSFSHSVVLQKHT